MSSHSQFVVFMSNPAGRISRVVVGLVLILVALCATIGVTREVLVAVGIVVFLAGALNVCLFAPLFRAPFLGKNIGKDNIGKDIR